MLFTFSDFDWKYSFFGKFGLKSQNCKFKVKFDTWTNSNMQNSVAVFTFLVFDQKCFFGQIWSEMSKLSV